MQLRLAIESVNDYEIEYLGGDTSRLLYYGVRLPWDVFLRNNRFNTLVEPFQQPHEKEMVSHCFWANYIKFGEQIFK